jgi:hypothetical protein
MTKAEKGIVRYGEAKKRSTEAEARHASQAEASPQGRKDSAQNSRETSQEAAKRRHQPWRQGTLSAKKVRRAPYGREL